MERLDDVTYRWQGPGRFRRRHWETKLTEQDPGARVGWLVIGGGTVLLGLRPEGAGTRVDLYAEMETDEGHPWRSAEDIRADLGRLKAWIEERPKA